MHLDPAGVHHDLAADSRRPAPLIARLLGMSQSLRPSSRDLMVRNWSSVQKPAMIRLPRSICRSPSPPPRGNRLPAVGLPNQLRNINGTLRSRLRRRGPVAPTSSAHRVKVGAETGCRAARAGSVAAAKDPTDRRTRGLPMLQIAAEGNPSSAGTRACTSAGLPS